jgi:hypothetical protein
MALIAILGQVLIILRTSRSTINWRKRGETTMKFLVLVCVVWGNSLAVFAIEPALTPKPEIQAKLAALKPNHGVLLGKAEIIGDFNDTARKYDLHKNGPRGRDFTIKMCWAPDRGRVLYCGANHGVPHRLNDVWEFDLPSLTWVMLYAPDNTRGYGDLGKDTSDVEFRDGILYTKRGGPAIIGHTWWGLTYDLEQKQLLFMNTWVTDKKKAVTDLGGNPEELYNGPPLWMFDPAKKTWRASKAAKPWPAAIFGGMLEYVPELKGSLWHANNWQMQGTWRHDFAQDTWTKLIPEKTEDKTFAQESPQPEQVAYYDPARHVIVAARQHDTFELEPKSATWKRVLTGNKEDGQTPFAHDARCVLYHDPKSGHGLMAHFERSKGGNDDNVDRTLVLWAYDPAKPVWTKLTPEGDPPPTGNKRLAYVDPTSNVLVVIDGVNVWAYRYR